jgi:hypothetical protein
MKEIKLEIDEKTAIKQIKKISQSLKKLVCDVCNRKDGAKSEWEGTIEVRNWGNEHDHGTICDECQEDANDNQ